MPELKTKQTEITVSEFLDGLELENRQAEGRALDQLFQEATGWAGRMWGPTIVGYGRYRYVYESGRSGEMCATGYSPRKADLAFYFPGDHDAIDAKLGQLGKIRLGKSCVYAKKLIDINENVMIDIIRDSLESLAEKWPVDAG